MTNKLEITREMAERSILCIEHGLEDLAQAIALADELRALLAKPAAQHQGEPVAYAAFSGNGNIRCWSRTNEAVGLKILAEEGVEIVPLYRHTIEQPAPVVVVPEGFLIVERSIWTEEQVEAATKCITMLKNVPGMTDRDLALTAMDAGQCKAPDITLFDLSRLNQIQQ